jgi:hypothetical protein
MTVEAERQHVRRVLMKIECQYGCPVGVEHDIRAAGSVPKEQMIAVIRTACRYRHAAAFDDRGDRKTDIRGRDADQRSAAFNAARRFA